MPTLLQVSTDSDLKEKPTIQCTISFLFHFPLFYEYLKD